MKTFINFVSECYHILEGNYSDEHAFRKVWNHFITHRRYGKEIRDLINGGKYDEARKAMEKEIASARENPKHPLSFEKAKRGFKSGKDTDIDVSQSTYYDELQLAPDSVVSYAKGRRGKSAANRPTAYAKVEGGATPPTTRMWKDVVGKEADTSKRDISIADSRNRKYGQGISLKQGEGSQTASAEPEEVRGLFQAAAKKYIQQLKKGGASREEIESFQRNVESNISKYIRAQTLRISPTENKEKSNRRLSIAQSAIDSLVKSYPGFDRLVDKEAASGEQKFGRGVSAQLDPESQEFKDALTALRTYGSGVNGSASKINMKDLQQGEYGRVDSIVQKYRKNPKKLSSILNNMEKNNKKYQDTLTALKVLRGSVDMESLEKGDKERVQAIRTKYKTYQQLSDFLRSSPSGQATEVVRGTYVNPKTGEVISRAKSEPVSQRGELDQEISARSGKGKSSQRESGYIEFEKKKRGEKTERIQRPGALALRVGAAEPDENKKDNQAQPQQGPITKTQFERRARLAAAEKDPEIQRIRQELRSAAAAEKQSQKALSKADRELEDANDEMQDASVPIDPDTKKPVLRQFRKNIEGHIAADPTSRTSRVNAQRRTRAELRLSNAQTNRDNAAATHDANVQQVQAQQQQQPAPEQPQQPQQAPQTPQQQPAPEQPQQPQQAPQTPEDDKQRRRKEALLKRMDAAGRERNIPEYPQ